MVKKAIAAGVLAGLVLFALFQHFYYKSGETQAVETSNATTGIGAGMVAPDFALKNLAGEEVSLKDYRGKKVMLNFWATWCPPCKEEMPAMEQFYKDNSSEVEILAVNLDPQNNVKEFVNDNGLSFPILLDQDGSTQQIYSILSIPTTFIIDEQGLILKKHIGSMTFEQMQELMK
ncbi:redoxin domain-containing protein [Mesobacillus subterraneus]|uniref:peroxiredoxin family protein n=1 Tax=Mesobacillus subterraneus TaxID=285983 RepID=UPI001CFEC4BD|nr:redoxin domain-containing protein [Mesobacillus subterraneus]WLR57078.1 redoxin domain-containing protein [Mesobacillus subterraneus]